MKLLVLRIKLEILGITAPNRVKDAPNVPTLKEQGYDVTFVNWRGFFGPPGMSSKDKNAVAKLLGDVQKTKEWEAVRKEMHGLIFIIRVQNLIVS